MPRISKKKQIEKAENSTKAKIRWDAPRETKNVHTRLTKIRKTNLKIWLDIDRTLIVCDTYGLDLRIQTRKFLVDFLIFCDHLGCKVGLITAAPRRQTLQKLKEIEIEQDFEILTGLKLIRWKHEFPDPSYFFTCHGPRKYTIGAKIVPDFDIKDTIIVDDIPSYYLGPQYDNVLAIKSFKWDHNDDALGLVAKFLKGLTRSKTRNIPEAIKEFTAQHPDAFTVKRTRKFEGPAI